MTKALLQTKKKLKMNASIVIALVILLTFTSLFSYKNVDSQWHDYSETAANVYVLHDKLIQKLGYGGFIHHFKNLVLRKNTELYLPKIKNELAAIKDLLSKLSAIEEYDQTALTDVTKTVSEYEAKLNIAIKMIAEGATSEQIDLVAKVDDAAALKALSEFETYISTILKDKSLAINNNFQLAYIVHILTIILLASILLVYFRKLSNSYKQQIELTERALEGTRIKSEFLANMSHEIRTPLNGIMGLLQILQPNIQKPNNIEVVAKALFSCRSLLTIINDILDFSKMEANELSVERIDFSLSRVVESINSDFLPVCNEKSIYLKIEVSDDIEDLWIGDPVRIRQILLNLVSNAVKFTEQGGVKVIVKKAAQREGIELDVIDTGIGMSKEGLSHLFNRFQQADNSITRRFGGTGLGMSITVNLINRMGGSIDVKSELGKGTRFTVYLPLKLSQKAHIDETITHIKVPDLTNQTVLIAEDNPLNTMIIKSMLGETNAELHFAQDGKQAIELFNKLNPRLVLMDIQMPNMGGIEACAHIRRVNEAVPIIALTANVMKENIIEYMNCGFNGHVGKPIEKHLLFNTINDVLEINQNEGLD
ncbi:response regulator [Pseudoalteromonas sp. MEBiC 03607]|uniref:ATP-binding protein n=1 Tax=Pseudoalteromonas sp. MEBiC 03607 TaxID=2563601 RepID=UPI001093635E|nr:ATP-binding protein [Pseudoalteromonas sp. MEBiC 03607]TGV20076.1 response regulator [Pseudoalteromonas sp. MEBiC 03607]